MADLPGGLLKSKFGLKEKLKLLSGGDNLQLPEIGDVLTVKILEDLQVAKSGKAFAPLLVKPIIDDAHKKLYAEKFEMVEENEYKFFLPLIGREHVSKYMKETNPNIANALLTVQVGEWKECPPEKIADRDDMGRAKNVSILRIEPDGKQSLEDALAQVGNTT